MGTKEVIKPVLRSDSRLLCACSAVRGHLGALSAPLPSAPLPPPRAPDKVRLPVSLPPLHICYLCNLPLSSNVSLYFSDDLQISSLLAQAHSRMLAITFSHSSGPSCVGLFLCISRPFLSLALVRFVSPPPLSPTCTPVPLEVVFLQGGAGGGSSSLVTLWSSRVLTMDSASVQKYD